MFSFFLNPSVIGERRDNEEREKENTLQTVAKKEEKKKHTTINQTHEDFAKKNPHSSSMCRVSM